MHIADFDIGMLGANGIVAGGISIITGAGLAAQMDGNGGVAVCFFGDGASNAGPFHESINIAATWKLPVIYVCENNLWAVNVPASDSVSVPDVAERAKGYGIPGHVVDGNDVLAVHEIAQTAVAHARAGQGPTLIECKTYRHRRHTERADQPDSRPQSEIDAWLKKDPIDRLITQLKQHQGQLTDEELSAIENDVAAELEAAVAFAKASAFPPLAAATEDVFAA
jgi:TPP-dependent pyruvate/acetoin dehydrogenase alpha subunit